ncbi:MAG: phosphotransferase [Bacteroidota bacterium]
MNLKQRFHSIYPTAFFLEKEINSVEKYLQQQGWLSEQETLNSLEKPGEGNMNFVLRATTNHRSFILKQARPWVEKFPQIDAPVERIAVEAQFFQSLERVDTINSFAPSCLGFDEKNFILATEDLGKGADYSFLYQKEKQLSDADIKSLLQYLTTLHQLSVPASFPANLAMRQLNHEHIFNFPYLEDNGFDLDTVQAGLQEAAMPYKKDSALKAKIAACGDLYLSAKESTLLHGDFYPGSWLKVADGLKVIDPEFGFAGPAAFDLSVLVAHLVMAEQSTEIIQIIIDEYQQVIKIDQKLLAQFAGIEILRRLIGIAQLPLSLDLNTKKILLKKASNWIQTEQLDFG